MPFSRIIRLGWLAAILSGVLLIVSELLYFVTGLGGLSAEMAASGSFVFQSVLFLLAGVLLLGGLLGLYAGHSEDLGILGVAGFLVAFVGTTLAVGSLWKEAFLTPTIAKEAPALVNAGLPALTLFGEIVSWGLLSIGWLLLGVAILRARVYPRAAAVLLIVGAVIAFFPLTFSIIPLGAAVIWIGMLSLSSGGNISPEQPSRVR